MDGAPGHLCGWGKADSSASLWNGNAKGAQIEDAQVLIHAADEALQVGSLGQGEDGGMVGRGGTGFE